MASELHPWRFELEICPCRVTLWTCIWAQTECSAGCDLWSIFSKCFEQSTSWCFGSHFFVARSHRFIAICHYCFLAFFLSFFFLLFFWKEKHGKKTPLSTFHCNQLQHTRSACFKTDLPDYFDSVLFKSCGSVVFLWRHGGHVTETCDFFSCRRRRCSKRRVCFHSNQYFYVPQENVNLSTEQREC